MNSVLLKPGVEGCSQVVLNGRASGDVDVLGDLVERHTDTGRV